VDYGYSGYELAGMDRSIHSSLSAVIIPNSSCQLDQEFPDFYKIRDYRIRTRGDKLVRWSRSPTRNRRLWSAAARELVYELAEYLSRRYPLVFSVTRHHYRKNMKRGWYGEGLVHTITILPFKRTFDLDTEDPHDSFRLSVRFLHSQAFLIIRTRVYKASRKIWQFYSKVAFFQGFLGPTKHTLGSDGRYYFQAGAIIIPGIYPDVIINTIGLIPSKKVHGGSKIKLVCPWTKIHTSGSGASLQVPVHQNYIIF